MKRLLTLVAATCLVTGCASPAPTMAPATQPATVPQVSGTPVETEYGPRGLTAPEGAVEEHRVDQVNNVTIVFSAPTGAELAAHYRRVLPQLGFRITGDRNNSLTFEDDQWKGAVTAAGSYSAITLRTDWEG